MVALGWQENAENAHRMLLSLGYWQQEFNPYPRRLALPTENPDIALAELPSEQRRDLTGMPAFAIDDEESKDPDDAISLDGQRIWVHVADVAALVTPDSDLDLEARSRGANLYLPDAIHPMLPDVVTERLGGQPDQVRSTGRLGLERTRIRRRRATAWRRDACRSGRRVLGAPDDEGKSETARGVSAGLGTGQAGGETIRHLKPASSGSSPGLTPLVVVGEDSGDAGGHFLPGGDVKELVWAVRVRLRPQDPGCQELDAGESFT